MQVSFFSNGSWSCENEAVIWGKLMWIWSPENKTSVFQVKCMVKLWVWVRRRRRIVRVLCCVNSASNMIHFSVLPSLFRKKFSVESLERRLFNTLIDIPNDWVTVVTRVCVQNHCLSIFGNQDEIFARNSWKKRVKRLQPYGDYVSSFRRMYGSTRHIFSHILNCSPLLLGIASAEMENTNYYLLRTILSFSKSVSYEYLLKKVNRELRSYDGNCN